ncbi:MAG: DUF4032 domain-containing protein [Calditrichaeota bacterium]|nr:MAG: DUF4032 domain-containing protein [Calditrichota bacterium]
MSDSLKPSKNIRIEIDVREEFFRLIASLPWNLDFDKWEKNKVNKLNIKSGIARHRLIFVRIGKYKFAIKEMSRRVAKKEIQNYQKLFTLGIPTLEPVGVVTKFEEPIIEESDFGINVFENEIGFAITVLAEKVLPDSYLYKREFTDKNRLKILDAAVKLFVQLHSKGIYWGDASLANLLIHFGKEVVPNLGKRTVLKAILADAETIEFPIQISDSLRKMDLEHFFEYIDWFAEDLRASGILKDIGEVEKEKSYILENYEMLIEIEEAEKDFEKITNLNVKKVIGDFKNVNYAEDLLKHIREHKWYLNQKSEEEISLKEAAQDWLENIFLPICDIFRNENLLEIFPHETAADLYVEIMQHKYFLSEKAEKDIGFINAMKSYCNNFGEQQTSPKLLKILTNAIQSILGKK